MKIAVVNADTAHGPRDVTDGKFGGAQLAPEYLSRALRDLGHDVTRISGMREEVLHDGIRYICTKSAGSEDFDVAVALRNPRWVHPIRADRKIAWMRDEHGHSERSFSGVEIVAISEYLKAIVGRLAPVLAVIPPGVSDVLFKMHISPHIRVCYTCGMWDSCRGVLEAISAYRIARERVRDLRLVLFGGPKLWGREPGGYARDVERAASAARGVTIMGTLGHADMMESLNDVSILLHPATSETFGLAVAEAMAAGRPVITRARAALREHHLDKYFEPNEMADAIVRLATDRSHFEAVAAKNRWLANRYRWSTVAAQWQEILCA